MLKYWVIGLSLVMTQVGLAADAVDALNLSGQYQCNGYDEHDGHYDYIMTLTLDAKNSDFTHNYGAYRYTQAQPDGKVLYSGEVAASGNTAAIYFKNNDPKIPTDRGVEIATVTYDRDQAGAVQPVLHGFYYEPSYHPHGGNGSEACVKQVKISEKKKS